MLTFQMAKGLARCAMVIFITEKMAITSNGYENKRRNSKRRLNKIGKNSMSRTKKGKKGPGHDYWGRRPLGLGDHGTRGKRVGIQRERAQGKKELIKLKKESQ